MKWSTSITLVIALGSLGMWGCGGRAQLKAGAEALSAAAEQCLIDVRDRRLTFETSRSCGSLSPLATAYIAAGGFQNEPVEIKLLAEQARTTAWMARAVSLAGGRMLSIW